MSIYNIGVASTYGGRNCGHLSGFVKIKGLTFILKNNMFLGHNFYSSDRVVLENDFYEFMYHGMRFHDEPNYPPFVDSYHDLTSSDIYYHKEVEKLKSIFSYNPLATFKACKINGVTLKKIIGTYSYNYIPYVSYVFDFEDIFIPISSYSHSPNMSRYNSSFENYQRLGFFDNYFNNLNFDYLSSLVAGSHYQDENVSFPLDNLGIPLGADNIFNTRSEFLIFDNIYYIFKPFEFPVFNGSRGSLSWNVYKIDFKKCCLAECFGITE
jgi:hypothetical protein